MEVFYLILAFLVALLFVFSNRRKGRGKPIPGPNGLPLFGSGFTVSSETMHFSLNELAKKYGDIVRLKVFKDTIVSLNTADMIRKALNEDPYNRIMNDRPDTFWGSHFLYKSQSIAFCPKAFGSIHGELRKGITRALHVYGDGIKEFEERINREINRLQRVLDNNEGRDFEFTTVIKRSVTNLMAYLLSGEDLQDDDVDVDVFWQLDYANEYLINATTNAILSTFPFLVKLPGKYKKVYDDAVDAKRRILRRYFQNIRDTHKEGEIRGVVDFLLDEQAREIKAGGNVVWTEECLTNAVIETIAAGILTTVTTVSNTILLMIHHPDYQDQVNKELLGVIGDRMPSLEDRQNCPLMEAVILESLRYIPPLPLSLPHFCGSDTEFEGYHIPAGSVLLPNIWYVHHDEAVWGDPWEFRPQRWLDESGKLLPASHPIRKQSASIKIQTNRKWDKNAKDVYFGTERTDDLICRRIFSWLAFGTGRRQCIGEQFGRNRLFLYLASLLKTYKFTGTPEKYGSCDPREGDFALTIMLRTGPFFCKAEKRV